MLNQLVTIQFSPWWLWFDDHNKNAHRILNKERGT